MIGLLTFSITIISLLFLLVLILPIFKVPMQFVKDYATVFNNLAIGIGALFAGFGSFRYIEAHLERAKLARKKEEFKRKYHPKGLGKDYHLIWFHRGKLYLFDRKEKLYYHIEPWETAQDLSFTDVGKKVEFGLDPKSEIEIPVDGSTVRPSDYENGGKINTTVL